jgi:hypothetical protein
MAKKCFALPLIIVFSMLTACSTTSDRNVTAAEMDNALRQATGQNGRTCVWVSDIMGFGVLSDSVISVSERRRNHYLMVTLQRCPGMQTASLAMFHGAFSEFCGGGRDSLTTRDSQCPVRSVFEFEDRQAAFDAYDQALSSIQTGRKSGNQ